MSNINDFKNKDTKFTGTSGLRISPGSTGQRVNEQARLRFNTTSNLMEYYTGTEWKSVDAPPTIVTFNINGGSQTTSTFVDRTLSGNATFVIIGTLFAAGATVSFIGTSATITASTVTVNSGNQITALIPHSSFLGAQEPYGIRVTNVSGLSATLEACLSVDTQPVFSTASGTLGTINDTTRSSYSLSSAAATDADGDTITYSITSGSLPPGLSISSSTGAITGTATAVVSNTTSTFTVSAATTNQTATRSFSITVNAPVVQSFTATGPATFSVPSGLTAVDVLVVAGGGSGGNQHGGGGGGGGLIYRPGFPVTPGGTVSLSVGAGGAGYPATGSNGTRPSGNGTPSTFGTLTAIGGGTGPSHSGSPGGLSGQPGGSGGGGNSDPSGTPPGGTGTQPAQPGDSGTFGFGNPGGAGHPQSPWVGGGGGGAGGAGSPTPGGVGGNAGTGRSYNISGSSVGYAGGGGGGGHAVPGGTGSPGFGGGNGNANPHPSTGQSGTANRGGGSGASASSGDATGPGGSGVVIVRF